MCVYIYIYIYIHIICYSMCWFGFGVSHGAVLQIVVVLLALVAPENHNSLQIGFHSEAGYGSKWSDICGSFGTIILSHSRVTSLGDPSRWPLQALGPRLFSGVAIFAVTRAIALRTFVAAGDAWTCAVAPWHRGRQLGRAWNNGPISPMSPTSINIYQYLSNIINIFNIFSVSKRKYMDQWSCAVR